MKQRYALQRIFSVMYLIIDEFLKVIKALSMCFSTQNYDIGNIYGNTPTDAPSVSY